MGIKCSLLGHSFGDTTVEREREEDGTEVVITIKEFETCERCGETRVVSENKEVTTLETPDEPVTDDEGGEDERASEEGAVQPTGDAGGGEPVEGGGRDAEIIDDESAEEAAAQAEARTDAETVIPDAEGEPTASDEVTEAEDDAVIIDEDDEPAPDRDPGEWPDEPDSETASVTDREWPEKTKEPERVREGRESDASQSDASDWPEEAPPADTGPDSLSGEEAVGETQADVTVPEGMFKCTDCGFTTEIESSAHREGDFCPECHHGTLVSGDGSTAGEP